MSNATFESTNSELSQSLEDDTDSHPASGVHAIAAIPGPGELGVDRRIRQVEPQTAWRPSAPVSESVARRAMPRSMQGVVGISEVLIDLFRVVDRVADATCSLLVTGESGTGKALVARAIHRASRRSDAGFVAVQCGGVPEMVLERELFGVARGAALGAPSAPASVFSAARGGTLFLDDVGELPLGLQLKLSRVLNAREYSSVGDTQVLPADFRVVAASTTNLEAAVRSGAFRQDLFYHLNGIHLTVPCLRERPEDVPLLVQHFLTRMQGKLGENQVNYVSRPAAQLLAEYHWPSNVRELENTIERAVLLCGGSIIQPGDLPDAVVGLGTERRVSARLPDAGLDLRCAVDTFENQLIRQALERTKWNKKKAAGLLGLNRTTLVEMLKRKRIVRAA